MHVKRYGWSVGLSKLHCYCCGGLVDCRLQFFYCNLVYYGNLILDFFKFLTIYLNFALFYAKNNSLETCVGESAIRKSAKNADWVFNSQIRIQFWPFVGESAILKSAKNADCGFNPQIRKAHLRIPQHRLKRWNVLATTIQFESLSKM